MGAGDRRAVRAPTPSGRLIRACRALLALDIAYAALAVLEPTLPGWHMFESADRVDVVLLDASGATLTLADYLPRGALVTDRREAERVARFICGRERARAPFTLVDRTTGRERVLGPAECGRNDDR